MVFSDWDVLFTGRVGVGQGGLANDEGRPHWGLGHTDEDFGGREQDPAFADHRIDQDREELLFFVVGGEAGQAGEATEQLFGTLWAVAGLGLRGQSEGCAEQSTGDQARQAQSTNSSISHGVISQHELSLPARNRRS